MSSSELQCELFDSIVLALSFSEFLAQSLGLFAVFDCKLPLQFANALDDVIDRLSVFSRVGRLGVRPIGSQLGVIGDDR